MSYLFLLGLAVRAWLATSDPVACEPPVVAHGTDAVICYGEWNVIIERGPYRVYVPGIAK